MRQLFATALIVTGLAVTAIAQTGAGTGSAAGDTSTNNMSRQTERNDDGFDYGWLGLIGLAGLIPRKQKVVHHDRVATDRTSPSRA